MDRLVLARKLATLGNSIESYGFTLLERKLDKEEIAGLKQVLTRVAEVVKEVKMVKNIREQKFYFGCPNCIEPTTTLKLGNHVHITATGTHFGAKVKVGIHCSVCDSKEDITEKIEQISFNRFIEMFT